MSCIIIRPWGRATQLSTLAKRLCVPSRLVLFGICCSVFLTSFAKAQEECDAACQAARKAQDPLAAVTALLTDNTIGFGPNSDSTTYNFQLQPVYTFEGEAANVILRGLIPYVGLPGGVAGADASLPEFAFSDSGGGTDFGFSDTIVQAFYVPEVEPGTFKIGYGVQLSFDTAEDGFNGPGNGAGLALVGFNFAGDLSYGGVVGHLWGENDFSLTTIQPIVFYNLENFLGGSYVGYSNTSSYNWNTGDWVVPVGATFGKTFVVGGGNAIDLNVGAYYLAEAPDNSNDWQLKFGVSWFLP